MIKLYDTTLRDGSQREGLSFSVDDKLKIAHKLDELGIHYIEGGWPGSNPKDIEFFDRVKKLKFKNATVVAFGSTRKPNISADKDKNLKALLEAKTKTVCIVGKTWDLHVIEALKTTLEENLKMISDSIKFLKKAKLEVVFDAEHFFDAYKNNPEYALEVLKTAEESEADWIVLCDTNGGTLPFDMRKIIEVVRKEIKVPLGIHAHNDSECGVANSLIAVEEGITQVQGTINGYGERCGNANLISIIPNLVLKMNKKCISKAQLKLLTETAHFVSEIANVAPDNHQPYVGQSAFTHKAGLHVSAITKNPETYEHINPELVGNIQRVIVSELAGKSTIVLKAKELGVDLSKNPERVGDILKKIKELEHIGYHFEAADGSFEILLRKATSTHREFFKLESFRVIMEKREDGKVVTEATIKLSVKNRRVIATAEGNGPVNALDKALRSLIGEAYPALGDIELTDYKVRVLNEKKGTAAVVRVLIETSDGKETWGTIGVSENIIEASWQALVDSIEYGLIHKKVR
jgi:2-isopropylmalate synthase